MIENAARQRNVVKKLYYAWGTAAGQTSEDAVVRAVESARSVIVGHTSL